MPYIAYFATSHRTTGFGWVSPLAQCRAAKLRTKRTRGFTGAVGDQCADQLLVQREGEEVE
jgi:hypothetical protein